jgi:hypothetical protein
MDPRPDLSGIFSPKMFRMSKFRIFLSPRSNILVVTGKANPYDIQVWGLPVSSAVIPELGRDSPAWRLEPNLRTFPAVQPMNALDDHQRLTPQLDRYSPVAAVLRARG